MNSDLNPIKFVPCAQDFLAEYMEQRKMLEQSLSTGATTIEPRDIKRYFEELMNLPLTGEDIRKLYELEEKGQNRQVSLKSQKKLYIN